METRDTPEAAPAEFDESASDAECVTDCCFCCCCDTEEECSMEE